MSLAEDSIIGGGRAACSLCVDVNGIPTRFDKRHIKRHIDTATHRNKMKGLTTGARANPEVQPSSAVTTSTTNSEGGDFDDDFGELFSTLFFQSSHESTTLAGSQLHNCANPPLADIFDDPPASQGMLDDDMPALVSDSDSNGDWETDSDKAQSSTASKAVHTPTTARTTSGGRWSPWPTKAMFLADALFTSPHLNFSRPQMRAVLQFANACGATDIPSLEALNKIQEQLETIVGDPATRYSVPSGNIYYVNSIAESIKKDASNPYVRPEMSFFPHMDGDRMSQAWNGHKLLHRLDDSFLTPCVTVNDQVLYVNELVRRAGGWFIPLRWILFGPNKELRAIGHVVTESPDGLHVHSNRRTVVPVATFLESFLEITAGLGRPIFDAESTDFEARMPHPLREVAGSRLVYSIPLIIFMDDASGNTSKQWNKHWSCYMSNAALRREALQLEYNVRFVTTSTHATPSELMHGIRVSIESAFNNPVIAFDCLAGQEVLVRPFALFWAGDNPMQAEHCSSSGLNSSHFCRTCMVGGSNEFKQSFEGYPTLFKSGSKRTAQDTIRFLHERLDMSIRPRMIQQIKEHTQTSGIKDSTTQPLVDRLTELNKSLRLPDANGLRRSQDEIDNILSIELAAIKRASYMNPLLDMPGVDIHRDTPTELLHTILLGVVKYFWAQTVYIVEKEKSLHILESRLASLSVQGLNTGKVPARYICQYRGSLVGKHFKMLVQLKPFAIFDLIPGDPNVICAWNLLGRLTTLLWYTEIEDINAYTEELDHLIDDFLLVTAQCSPSILVLKPKFHFLVHISAYVRRFGPALLFSTERFESFNGIFRAASTFSNRQAPSRDIARRLAHLDRTKHIVAGGYWLEGNQWVRASDEVLRFASTSPIFTRILGIPRQKAWTPGAPHWRASVKPQEWSIFSSHHKLATNAPGSLKAQYYPLVSVIAQSGDVVASGSDILFDADGPVKTFGHATHLFGCVEPNQAHSFYVVAQLYQITGKHALWDVPLAIRSSNIVCIPSKAVDCLLNVQHDCHGNGPCSRTEQVFETQEREETRKVLLRTAHAKNSHFVINIHGLHNAQRIRRALLADVFARTPLGINREEIMQEAVKRMKTAKEGKTIVAAAKKDARAMVSAAVKEAAQSSSMPEGGTKRTGADGQNSRPKRPRTHN